MITLILISCITGLVSFFTWAEEIQRPGSAMGLYKTAAMFSTAVFAVCVIPIVIHFYKLRSLRRGKNPQADETRFKQRFDSEAAPAPVASHSWSHSPLASESEPVAQVEFPARSPESRKPISAGSKPPLAGRVFTGIAITVAAGIGSLVGMVISVFSDPSTWLLTAIPMGAAVLVYLTWFHLFYRGKHWRDRLEPQAKSKKLIWIGWASLLIGEIVHILTVQMRPYDDPLANRILPLAVILIVGGGSVLGSGYIMKSRNP